MTQIKPIIFSAPMVRALLDGRKTQTRRVLRPQPDPDEPIGGAEFVQMGDEPGRWCWLNGFDGSIVEPFSLPYTPGDLLWVRENWSGHHVFRHTPPSQRSSFAGEGMPYLCDEIWYWADGSPEYGDWEKPRPSIHMPRKLSRLTLRVTDVRVQRAQEISEADALAEGVGDLCGAPREGYQMLWEDLNAKRGFGWADNPWVAAYTFEVIRKNVDEVAE